MAPQRTASLIALVLLLAAAAAAQEIVAPTFTLAAPPACNAAGNYTCDPRVSIVDWMVPPRA